MKKKERKRGRDAGHFFSCRLQRHTAAVVRNVTVPYGRAPLQTNLTHVRAAAAAEADDVPNRKSLKAQNRIDVGRNSKQRAAEGHHVPQFVVHAAAAKHVHEQGGGDAEPRHDKRQAKSERGALKVGNVLG